GHVATLWRKMAGKLGLVVDFVAGDWRTGVDPEMVESRLGEDKAHAIKAVMVVHNETSTGVTSRIPAIRKAIDRASHPALFMVDTISSLASIDYRHAEWGVDVTVAGRFARGAWKFYAAIPPSTAARLPRSLCRTATTRTPSAAKCWRVSICRWVRVSAVSPDACSASAISGI